MTEAQIAAAQAAARTHAFGVTPELVDFVKAQEGLVLHPYRCPAGYPTIGYGRRIPDMTHPPITKLGALQMLIEDLATKRDILLALDPFLKEESERRVAALVDFVFNCGEGAYRASTMRKRVKAKDWAEAAREMRRWVHVHQDVFGPLVARRKVTSAWLEQG